MVWASRTKWNDGLETKNTQATALGEIAVAQELTGVVRIQTCKSWHVYRPHGLSTGPGAQLLHAGVCGSGSARASRWPTMLDSHGRWLESRPPSL